MEKVKKQFESRKWQLAVFIELAATIGLFIDKLTGSEWVSISIVVLGAYTAANIAGDKLPNRGWNHESRIQEPN